jgi:hypothetical protein
MPDQVRHDVDCYERISNKLSVTPDLIRGLRLCLEAHRQRHRETK